MPMSQMGGGEGDDLYRPIAEINVTPFVDVMLVLLIVFMVAAPLMTAGVAVQLPRTEAGRTSETRRPIVVSIDREGQTFVGEEPLASGALRERLGHLAAQNPEAVAYVRGDRRLPYGDVMTVMGQVSSAGFTKVVLLAERSATAPGS
jgi:biopolymer transport protein ExbD